MKKAIVLITSYVIFLALFGSTNASTEPIQVAAVEELQLTVGVSAQQGKPSEMEDANGIFQDAKKRFVIYIVCDGHGGTDAVAHFVKDNLPKRILAIIAHYENPTPAQIQDALRVAFTQIEAEIAIDSGGSTAVLVLIDKQQKIIYCGNLGDSRAVLCSDGKAVALSNDHNIIHDGEKERIIHAGGTLQWGMIGGKYSVSRAFGDKKIKKIGQLAIVMSEPEIQTYSVTRNDQFLIIASDGLWDSFGNQTVVSGVAKCLQVRPGNAEFAAVKLVQAAINDRLQGDNVTAMVVLLR